MELQAVNHTKIVTSCQQILNSALGGQVILSPDSQERYSSNLAGYNYYGATDRGRLLKVVPFYKEFWLHFSIQFDIQPRTSKKYDYFIEGTSIVIFYGQATDNDKLLMFRAEWDNKRSENVSVFHPQPHWHVHSSGSDLKADDISDFNVFIGMKEQESNAFLNEIEPNLSESNKAVDLSGFHFAMSAGWFFDKPDTHVLTEETLKIWLTRCIAHIREQIQYCY